MIGGIILTHGPIAQALIKAAEEILGKVTNIYGFSTSDLSMEAISQRMDEIFSKKDWTKETLIFVSLKGGSCWNAALMKKQHPNIEVISGVNLSMILSFLTKRHQYTLAELAIIVRDDGIKGIDKY